MRQRNNFNSKTCDPQAAKWIANAVNPFPDQSVDAVGYPTISSSRTLPQTISLTTTVTAPPAVGVGNPWEAVVTFIPCCPDVNSNLNDTLLPYSVANNGLLTYQNGIMPLFAGLNIITGGVGMDWGSSTNAANSVVNNNALSIPVAYAQSQWRLVACGYEIVNTTASLYQQGSITTVRTPSSSVRSTINFGTASVPNNIGLASASLPPTSCSVLSQFPGAITRQAATGSYAIMAFNALDNPMIKPCLGAFAIGPMGAPSSASSANRTTWVSRSAGSVHSLPLDITTSHLCGLSSQTSLTVTVHYYIERVPGPQELTLATLTKPSTPFDPVVLEIYSRVLSDLPFDVPQGENPLGEWFSSVLQVAKAVAPAAAGAIGTLIGGPAGGLAGYKIGSAVSSAIPIAETQSSTRNVADDNSKIGVVRSTMQARETRDVENLRRELHALRSKKRNESTIRPSKAKKKSSKGKKR